MKILLFASFTLTLVIGCRVISKQELSSVQAIAKGMAVGSKLPADYTRQYYDVALESSQLGTSYITNPTGKVNALNGLIADRLEADSIVKGYSSGYEILNKYAELILALTDDSTYQKNLSKQKDAFIPSFDTLVSKYNSFFPKNKLPVTSLGGLVSNIIQEVGSRRIRYLQRKYLKNLISEADATVSFICDTYKAVDFYANDKRLSSLDKTLSESYKSFMNRVELDTSVSNAYAYFKLYDPIYLGWKNKQLTLTELNKNNLKAIENIKTAHHKLKVLLSENPDAKDIGSALKDLYASIHAVNESYQKFHKSLTPSN